MARAYLAGQALAGAAWWMAVFASHDIRRWTLGGWPANVMVGPDVALFVVAALIAAVTSSRVAAALTTIWTLGITVALLGYSLATGRAGWGAAAMTVASVGAILAGATLWFGQLPTSFFFTGPFRFREADGRSPRRQLRRSLGQLVVFWSTFFLAVPAGFVWAEHRMGLRWPLLASSGVHLTGAVLFVVASAIGLWSCFTMALIGHGTPLPAATAPRLVVAGPYRWVRNPMAVAGSAQTIGVGLWCGSWTVAVLALAGCVAWNQLIRPTEEADLAARFGPPYDEYHRHVRCWIPIRRT